MNADAQAQAKVIDSKAELESAANEPADEDHIRRVASAMRAMKNCEAEVLKKNPLLIQKNHCRETFDKCRS